MLKAAWNFCVAVAAVLGMILLALAMEDREDV